MVLYVMKPDPEKKDAIARKMIEKGYIFAKRLAALSLSLIHSFSFNLAKNGNCL